MNIETISNIKAAMKSFSINKKKRSRKLRFTTFLKEQKRTVRKTLKADKIYRQNIENFHEQMFNSTLPRSNEKLKKKFKFTLETHRNHEIDERNSQISEINSQPLLDSNVRIVISKVVINPTKDIDSVNDTQHNDLHLLEWAQALPQCSVELCDLNLNSRPMSRTEMVDDRNAYIKEFINIKELHAENFFQLTRMSKSLFDDLSNLVSSEDCLAMTLIYLAGGVNLDILSQQFGVAESTAQSIILTTSKQLLDGLKPKVLLENLSYTDLYETALQYQDECDLPNCVGSIDARYLTSTSPSYSNKIAIDILATCRPNFLFTSVEISHQHYPIERRRDILNESKLMREYIVNIPTMQLPNSSNCCQGFFVAPKSFPNTINLVKQSVHIPNEINRRLRRAVNVIDMAFALLKRNWKCLDRQDLVITTATEVDVAIVWVVMCLHNYILMNGDAWLREQYCPVNYIEQFDDNGKLMKGKWRRDLHQGKTISKIAMKPTTVNRGSKKQESHDEYFDYILNEGCVEWQKQPQ